MSEDDESSAAAAAPSELALDPFLQLIGDGGPELPLLATQLLLTDSKNTIGDDNTNANNARTTRQLLQSTCANLFSQLERYAHHYNRLDEEESTTKTASDTVGPPLLSDLHELYVPSNDNDNNDTDAEMLWGQVEFQNKNLLKLLKKSVRKLAAASSSNSDANDEENSTTIRLLKDEIIMMPDDHDDDSSSSSDDSTSGSNNESPPQEAEEDDEDDEETKRMRLRMERAMEDMDDDMDDGIDGDDAFLKSDRNTSKKGAGISPDDEQDKKFDENDRDALDLHDGFFNLQEMEAFADEEEEYLPDEAYGQEEPEQLEKKSAVVDTRTFHQKLRDGDDDMEDGDGDSDSDDEDAGDGDDLLFRKESFVRRRKYRDDDEIDALYSLYNKDVEQVGDKDDNDDDDVIHMTAADLFGKPRHKYYERYYKPNNRKQRTAATTAATAENENNKDDDDADSWNDYKFEQEGNEKSGWNDHDDDGASCSDSDGPDDNVRKDAVGGVDSDQDEEITMEDKQDNKNPKQQQFATKQAARIQAQTEQIEKEMLAEKPWQMTGEAGSSARPVNSLLESTPEFEVASKQAPIITVEHTANLEDVIKQRILAEDWDDVIPRELPDVGWHKKHGELPEVSQEKSKLGLGELYEREYLKKAVGYDVDAAEKETEEQKAKNEMKTLFANLCSKLDALSNYQFAPRPVADEADIRTVAQPAIAMEEVLPLHTSDARAVAPEEVYGTSKKRRDAVLRSESELDQQDRKRLRSAKKAARRKARKEKLADEKLISRLQPGLGLDNPYEKRKMREELSMARASGKVSTGAADMNEYGASGTFFQRMQEEAQQTIHVQKEDPSSLGSKKSAKKSSRSSALKL